MGFEFFKEKSEENCLVILKNIKRDEKIKRDDFDVRHCQPLLGITCFGGL
jgi:hypothetical protein